MSNKVYSITEALCELMRDNWSQLGLTGREDVYYGDQPRYPRTPSIAVDSGPTTKSLNQIGMHAEETYLRYILIFHSPIQSLQMTEQEIDQHAETVADLLEQNRSLGGLVIHSHVTAIEPGLTERGGTLLKTTRLTWTGISKTRIGA